MPKVSLKSILFYSVKFCQDLTNADFYILVLMTFLNRS